MAPTTNQFLNEYNPRHMTGARLPFRPSEHHESSCNSSSGGVMIAGDAAGPACPCCNRNKQDHRETLNEPCSRAYRPHALAKEAIDADKYLNTSLESTDTDVSSDSDEEHDELPGVLQDGVEYRPKRILAEGWLHKKGTGKDWFGSRAWKPRYCRLVVSDLTKMSNLLCNFVADTLSFFFFQLAQVENFEVELPLFLVYWYPSSETPSTVISLDSTVVLPMDQDDKDAWNHCCFQIIHAKGGGEDFKRTFTVPQKGRDAWVLSITQALHDYVKAVAKHKKKLATSPPAVENTKPRPSLFMEEDCVELAMPSSSSFSPPSSPRERRPLPRPVPREDVLVGEAFL